MLIIYYEVIVNIIAFLMYGIDKFLAVKQKFRIPEARLIFIAFIGGAFGALLGMKLFHHKTLKAKFKLVPFFFVLQVVLAGFCLYQNLHIVVTNYSYSTDKTAESLRIVQISDLHNQFFGFKQRYLLDKIEELQPDIITVTGDAVDSNHTNYTPAYDFFEGAVDIAPVYYITGNHEFWLKKEAFDEFVNDIEGLGVVFADDMAFDMGGYTLVGLSDKSLDDNTLSELVSDKEKFVLLLAHEPKYHDNYKNCADLALTGHVHGGQFRLPDKGGLISPDFEFFPELTEGRHEYGNMTMIISRGLGNSVVPLRLFNYPEIVAVDINK